MEGIRKPMQGVANIVRFNWPFFAISGGVLLVLILLTPWLPQPYQWMTVVAGVLIVLPLFVSLLASWYIYDRSPLYSLTWLDSLHLPVKDSFLNIHAGFDETSHLLRRKYPNATMQVFDFYNPALHTEPSIQRARKAYPPYPNTQIISTLDIPLADQSADVIFVIFAAHEIRDDAERVLFFQHLRRVLKEGGRIVMTAHLRDVPNFLVYNMGFLHFLPLTVWEATFAGAGLRVSNTIPITPFVTTFSLEKNGITP